jgi:hypothetical protein
MPLAYSARYGERNTMAGSPPSTEPIMSMLFSCSAGLWAMALKRKRRPSGSMEGQRWLVCSDSSMVVSGVGSPPLAGTRWIAVWNPGEKRISSSGVQVPPRPTSASQIL